MTRLITLIALAILLPACTVFNIAPPANEQVKLDVPDRFSMYSGKAATSEPWWKSFNNPQLNKLISDAISENFSIKEAKARLKQANISAAKSNSSLSPSLNFSGSGAHITQKNKGTARTANESWTLGLSASYEVDLWGRLLADKNSMLSETKASQEDIKTAIMTVTGKIAENWTTFISLEQQKKLYLKELELQQQLLVIIKLRFPAGQATALNIYQQQQAIERISASLIPITSKQESIKRQVTFLSRKSTLSNELFGDSFFPMIPKIPTIGIPADLIGERPDVRAAGLRLNSSQWKISAARADRLPALKLTASHTHSSAKLTDILDNWLLNLAANMTGPIFDGNRSQLEVERTKAVVEERLETYRKIVHTAIKEVEDALADESQFTKTISSLSKQLILSEKTIKEARNRYLNGSSDFLNVLQEELKTLQIQQNIIISKEKKILARINLYKSLGGAWLDKAKL